MKTAQEMKTIADNPESEATTLATKLAKVEQQIKGAAARGEYKTVHCIGHYLQEEVIANLIKGGFKVTEYSGASCCKRVSWA